MGRAIDGASTRRSNADHWGPRRSPSQRAADSTPPFPRPAWWPLSYRL